MTLCEAQTGGAFDCLNWQHSGEFDQNFSKKSNAPGFARGGEWAVMELTGTLSFHWGHEELPSIDLRAAIVWLETSFGRLSGQECFALSPL